MQGGRALIVALTGALALGLLWSIGARDAFLAHSYGLTYTHLPSPASRSYSLSWQEAEAALGMRAKWTGQR